MTTRDTRISDAFAAIQELAGAKFGYRDGVIKTTGDYTGPGVICGLAILPNGKLRYLVGHAIEGGTGELLHVYSEGNLRAIGIDRPAINGLASDGGGKPKT